MQMTVQKGPCMTLDKIKKHLAADELLRTLIPDRRTIVYLREVDGGTDNACWVVCAKGDMGAWAFAPLDFA